MADALLSFKNVRSGYGEAVVLDDISFTAADRSGETITIERDFNQPGVSSIAGVLSFRDYGSYIEDIKRGETVAIDDVALDP